MQAKWYIEKEFFWEGQPDTILSVLDKLGIQYYLQKYKSKEDYKSDMYPNDDCVIIHGSIGFLQRAKKQTPWIPGGLWFAPDLFKCSTYYGYYGKYLLNQKYAFYPYGELLRLKDSIFETYGEDGKLFVRPDSGMKDFTGCVIDKNDIEGKITRMSYGEWLAPSMMVLVAKPQKIISEERFYLCKNEVITGSRYMLNGEHDEAVGYSGNALRLAEEISKEKWSPAHIFVADIGTTDSGECRLLEINSFNSSSMYLCDMEKIVKKANQIAEGIWEGVYGGIIP
jgi:hypothetical protein